MYGNCEISSCARRRLLGWFGSWEVIGRIYSVRDPESEHVKLVRLVSLKTMACLIGRRVKMQDVFRERGDGQ